MSRAADHSPPRRLADRRVLITGASSGVGLEAARRFAEEGARLALVGRSEDTLAQVIAEHGLDAVAIAIAADVTDRERIDAAIAEAVEALGGLDVVVSNAGVAVFGHVLEVHPDDFDRAVAVTFTGAVNVVRAALPHLRASRGTIVATGSLNARVPLPTWSSYAAAKHALRGFLNSLAVEEREQRSGVRVAIVHPGPIDTPLFAQASSATGIQPRVAPESYSAGMVAQALVEVAVRPRPEVVLGGETRLLDLMFLLARPVGEGAMLVIDRWFRSGDEPADHPGSLWVAPRHPQSSGGIPARDSLLAPLQLGRRLLPAPATPLRFVGHVAVAAWRAKDIAGALRRPATEQPPPAAGLADAPRERPARAGAVTL
jgi:NAD(P)-dependent dehydrogenase (short-subunit alcohol dehydrogenase family)